MAVELVGASSEIRFRDQFLCTPALYPRQLVAENISTEMITSNVEVSLLADETVGCVFPTSENADKFVGCLETITDKNWSVADVVLGGRKPREALGCHTFDFSEHVVDDAFGLEAVKRLRLGPYLLDKLKDFPTKRMLEPDLDFFVQNGNLDVIQEIFDSKGFSTKMNLATGGVQVLDVRGDLGNASFILWEDSFQTRDSWPKFGGVKAVFSKSTDNKKSSFDLSKCWASLYLYPLEMGLIGLPADCPERFSAVSRALLWSLTATDPSGRMLKLPCPTTTRYMCDTVSQLIPLIAAIESGKVDGQLYNGSIRDMALALRVIELSDNLGDDFFSQISGAFWSSRPQIVFAVQDKC